MDILVVGGSGLVGTNIVEAAKEKGFNIHATYRTTQSDHTDIELDKTDSERTVSIIERLDPDVVVDTAAYHAVDDCETKRDTAWMVNAAGTRNAATAANAVDAHFIYLSTDYVFPGYPEQAPYTESEPVLPLNYYAETKYAGEQAAKIAEQHTILRPSVIYGLESNNFVTWVLEELRNENEIGIVEDQVSAPTYAPDLADSCLQIAEYKLTGLYHATGPQSVSRFEFTKKLANAFGLNEDLINPITTKELGQEAPRPENSTLDSSKLYEELKINFCSPEDAFADMQE